MVPNRRSPSRPGSNESCSTADSVKNGGLKKGSSSSLHEDKNGTESMSPVDVKQEPGSPSGDVSWSILFSIVAFVSNALV